MPEARNRQGCDNPSVFGLKGRKEGKTKTEVKNVILALVGE
jgi:hypothetical protein